MPSPLVWLITGTSSGIGRQLALEALKRGDKVIATGRARSIKQVEDHLKEEGADILELDVTSPMELLEEIAKTAVSIHGRIDVLVNNAGYGLLGVIEASSHQQTLDQFNTNLFGALNVTRAFLPYMREKRTGTIIFAGSLAGWTGLPYCGPYVATRWALRGVSQTLHNEISPLGLRSTCIDFGHFRTRAIDNVTQAVKAGSIPDYQEQSDRLMGAFQNINGKQPGDPAKAAEVIVDVIKGDGSASGKAFPLNLVLGADCFGIAQKATQDALANLATWKEVSVSTDFKD